MYVYTHIYTHLFLSLSIYTYIYIYIYVILVGLAAMGRRPGRQWPLLRPSLKRYAQSTYPEFSY